MGRGKSSIKDSELFSQERQQRIVSTLCERVDSLGLSQRKLATMAGISKDTISRILRGAEPITPNNLERFKKVLGMNDSDFTDGEIVPQTDAQLTAFVEYGGEIKKFTSFNALENWLRNTKEKAKSLPSKARGIIELNNKNKLKINSKNNSQPFDASRIILDQIEVYDATSQLICAFRKNDDEITFDEQQEGMTLNLGNMINKFPFMMDGVSFYTSESAYICGLFSKQGDKYLEVQSKLIAERNGYAAKKDIRAKYEAALARDDWETFNIDWMLYVVWQKTLNNKDFQAELLNLPRNAILLENSAFQKAKKKGDTRAIWGCTNEELLEASNTVEDFYKQSNPKMKKAELQGKMSVLRYIGKFEGKNLMGKILMLCRHALLTNTVPPIDFDNLRRAQIYLNGKLLTFDDYIRK